MSSSSSLHLIFACGCRYRAPYMHLSLWPTPTPFPPPRRHRHLLPFSARHGSSPIFTLLYTGNPLFSRMEVSTIKNFRIINHSFRRMVHEQGVKFLKILWCLQRFLTGGNITRNKGLVEYLKRYGMIKSNKVGEVMEAIDRGLFVPEGPAYEDSPMAIDFNATISAPHMHAMCLELLEKNLQPGMRALDVGSGTGYLTACFAIMVGAEGRAIGVEHIPELAATSVKNIEKCAAAPLLKEGSLSIHVGDGRLGWPDSAPYDAIHVGAAAPEIPQALIDQLKPGGRLVIPVGKMFQELKVIDKNLDGSITARDETSVRYVPLTSREEQIRGV